jgi:hypothetical protein
VEGDPWVHGEGEKGLITFFAMEWTSPRSGKVIQETRLKGSFRFRGAVPGFEKAYDEPIPNNAIILKVISCTQKRNS